MNNAQTESILTKVIVGATATAVAKYGVNTDQWTEVITWAIGGLVTVGTLAFSHWFHSTNNNNQAK